MFRSSNRILSKSSISLFPTKALPKPARAFLLATKPSNSNRLYASQAKIEQMRLKREKDRIERAAKAKIKKPSNRKITGEPLDFEYRDRKFIIHLVEQKSMSEKKQQTFINVTLVELNLKTEQYLGHIWMSIPAVKRLLKELDKAAEEDMGGKRDFKDEERNVMIELRLGYNLLRTYAVLCIEQWHWNGMQYGRQTVSIPLEMIEVFENKLREAVKQYERLQLKPELISDGCQPEPASNECKLEE